MDNSRIDNISGVFQVIRNHEKEHKDKFSLYDSKLKKILLCICICSFVVTFIFALYRPGIWAIILLLISIVSFTLYVISGVLIPIGKKILKPIDSCLEEIQESAETEGDLIKSLANVDISILEQAIKRLGLEIERLEKWNTEITGLIHKFGIVPALIALYIVLSKKDIPVGESIITLVLCSLVFVMLLFIGSFLGLGIIERLKWFLFIIESAKDKSQSKSVL